MNLYSHRSALDYRQLKARIVRSSRTIQKTLVIAIFSLLLLSIISYTAFASSNMSNTTTNTGVNSTSNVLYTQFSNESGNKNGDDTARSVILLIGDGMDDSEITIARNYELGVDGRLVMDTFPFTGAVTTYVVEEDNSSVPNYVPDSAASGTAWSTGEKTSNGRISTTPSTDKDLKTLLEIAQDNGLSTGIVTTAELTDATPAV
jgi:alkaline phosphatase/streptomycin-6-phosphatase